MDSKRLKVFLTERRHLDFLRELEVYCSYPASPDVPDPVSDPDMEVESKPAKEPTKRPAAVRPSEDFDSDSDPGWSDRRVVTSGFPSKKPKSHPTLLKPYPSNRIIRFMTPQQSEGSYLKQHPRRRKILIKRKVTKLTSLFPHPAPHGPKSLPVFGIKLQAITVTDFRNLKNLLITQGYVFHIYVFKEDQEIRIVRSGFPREIPIGGQGRPPLPKSPGADACVLQKEPFRPRRLRRVERPRAVSATLGYARAAAGSRSVSSTVKQNQSSTADY
ncbi:hypothetical protein EVAR_6597_1 [Eumeta japonica]|uniref:Uncharacterized protein n=1 Tax=Eumeta variegata TaxID=151549 RepID=A0A4C1TL63_EUMVA|nr:hypothetical protein EVAR_6597_1 [Eumeta japonica]